VEILPFLVVRLVARSKHEERLCGRKGTRSRARNHDARLGEGVDLATEHCGQAYQNLRYRQSRSIQTRNFCGAANNALHPNTVPSLHSRFSVVQPENDFIRVTQIQKTQKNFFAGWHSLPLLSSATANRLVSFAPGFFFF